MDPDLISDTLFFHWFNHPENGAGKSLHRGRSEERWLHHEILVKSRADHCFRERTAFSDFVHCFQLRVRIWAVIVIVIQGIGFGCSVVAGELEAGFTVAGTVMAVLD